jgi:hypothetical protein
MIRITVILACWTACVCQAWSQDEPMGPFEPLVIAPLEDLPTGQPPTPPRAPQPATALKQPASSPMQTMPELIEVVAEERTAVVGPSGIHTSSIHSSDFDASGILSSGIMSGPPPGTSLWSRCYRSEATDAASCCPLDSACHSQTCPHGCPPYRSRNPLVRMKRCLQESHWGYCNYFDERPFGDSVVTILGVDATRSAAADEDHRSDADVIGANSSPSQ